MNIYRKSAAAPKRRCGSSGLTAWTRGIMTICGIALTSQALPAQHSDDLLDLSIEQLMNEPITSVSKRSERLGDAASAITVLSNDDLHRSGATTVAEALRLVPGLDVAASSSGQWAISARGFNGLNANKLLVLVDGRAVYNDIFAGVAWEMQQLMLEDIDRIEVIRGPGATVWGANAVNGVINIVTRSAADSQGSLVYGGGGNVHEALGGWRFGDKAGEHTYYRLFSTYSRDADQVLADDAAAGDGWQTLGGGLRVDHYPQPGTHVTWQAGATRTDLEDGGGEDVFDFNTLGRWTRVLSERSALEAQAYFDHDVRDQVPGGDIQTLDFSLQHTLGLTPRNDVIWGAGYRHTALAVRAQDSALPARDATFEHRLFNVFLQDEFKVIPQRLSLTLGLKIEHNSYTGFEFQPSLRATFKPAAEQTLWAAVSRAVRMPAALEGRNASSYVSGAPIAGPGGDYLPMLAGNADIDSEVLWAYETGYRVQLTPQLNLDLAAFYNDYSNLIDHTQVPVFIPGTPLGTALIRWDNLRGGKLYGSEIVAVLSPADDWRLTASYSLLVTHVEGLSSLIAGGGGAPRHKASLRSSHDLTERVSVDAALRYIDSIVGMPAYATLDLNLICRLSDTLQLSVAGQNLLQSQHAEQVSFPPWLRGSEVSRGFYAKLTSRF